MAAVRLPEVPVFQAPRAEPASATTKRLQAGLRGLVGSTGVAKT